MRVKVTIRVEKIFLIELKIAILKKPYFIIFFPGFLDSSQRFRPVGGEHVCVHDVPPSEGVSRHRLGRVEAEPQPHGDLGPRSLRVPSEHHTTYLTLHGCHGDR